MKKKILVAAICARDIHNFHRGIINAFKTADYEVIASAQPDSYEKYIDVEYIPLKNSGPAAFFFRDFYLLYQLIILYSRLKPDLILHFTIKINIYGALAARLLKMPCINSITGLGSFFTHKNIITLVILFLYRLTQRYPKKVCFLNNEDRDFFLKTKIVSASQIEMIPGSGVDTEKYMPAHVIKKSGSRFIFLLFARMIWDKGIKEYIEAARMMLQHNNNVKFQLLGFLNCSNPYAVKKRNIDKWVDEGVVEYLGETENVVPYITNADCIVLPSYYGEGLPRVLLEAMSMEKPVIATNHVGCRDLVDDGENGFLCEIKNYRDLFDKMQKMINLTGNERMEMGKRNRIKVLKNFSDKIVTARYLQIIDAILAKHV